VPANRCHLHSTHCNFLLCIWICNFKKVKWNHVLECTKEWIPIPLCIWCVVFICPRTHSLSACHIKLIIGLFCGKWPVKIRYHMRLRHSVHVCSPLRISHKCMSHVSHRWAYYLKHIFSILFWTHYGTMGVDSAWVYIVHMYILAYLYYVYSTYIYIHSYV